MNFAERTRESSSSDGWKFKEDEEDEENAKHIIGVEQRQTNEKKKKNTSLGMEKKTTTR